MLSQKQKPRLGRGLALVFHWLIRGLTNGRKGGWAQEGV